MLRKILVAAVCAVTMAGLSAGAAFAGEITGNGKPTAGPLHANSICVFSGRNDDPGAPITLDPKLAPNGPGGISQSYGQDVRNRLISPQDFNPGAACRGGSN